MATANSSGHRRSSNRRQLLSVDFPCGLDEFNGLSPCGRRRDATRQFRVPRIGRRVLVAGLRGADGGGQVALGEFAVGRRRCRRGCKPARDSTVGLLEPLLAAMTTIVFSDSVAVNVQNRPCPPGANLSWITGLREVFVKDPTGNRVGYFDDVTKAPAAVAGDGEYRAVWFSLNVCPGVPEGFVPNRLYKASGRLKRPIVPDGNCS